MSRECPMRTILASRVTRRVSIAVAVSAALITASAAAASAATTASGTRAAGNTASAVTVGSAAAHGMAPGTRFFVPPPSSGAPQQVLQLLKGHDLKDAALIAEMEAFPRAVWFTSGTPAQVEQ